MTIDTTQPHPSVTVGETATAQYDALLGAMQTLDRAVVRAAPAYEVNGAAVADALRTVRDRLQDHLTAAEATNGLLPELLQAMPRARFRISQIQQEHRRLIAEAEALLSVVQADPAPDLATFEQVRRTAANLLEELRSHLSQQVDLIYDACDEDIGVMD